jgi:hypothetical protein
MLERSTDSAFVRRISANHFARAAPAQVTSAAANAAARRTYVEDRGARQVDRAFRPVAGRRYALACPLIDAPALTRLAREAFAYAIIRETVTFPKISVVAKTRFCDTPPVTRWLRAFASDSLGVDAQGRRSPV